MIKTYRLENLDCANCAAKMETAVSKLSGVKSAAVNFMAAKITIEFEDGADIDAVAADAAKAVRKIEPGTHLKI